MLPHPEGLTLPLKEGMRDLRSSIRLEARSGLVSSHLFGTAEPVRHLARLADGVLTRAERAASRVRPREDRDLGHRLDRMAQALGGSGFEPGADDLYAVCREVLEREGRGGVLVSELALATADARRGRWLDGDDALRAARAAWRLLATGAIRPCLSTVLLPAERDAVAEVGARVALGCWLAVLVRHASRRPGAEVLDAVALALEAEGDEWARLLRGEQLDALAASWRRTVPYLP
ncbi:hypothetical protein [Aureimonas jatrophae]|uniref:Uncharacterized protein n=1 Tax=Aureimonas jatrophae TaxID=1166073 RepID=A0A1H0L9Q8_9HYPH|nr:hypothetical protein [Aureimonas jatrophae]MBB3952459.1 hypothetical protein [Aureimonas jatrophae]SDO64680.1 hypothetical protein SAMN05192530_10992 [Aureimonas jatrophae]